MSQVYNIYCDESCHLERDGQKAMVLGAVWIPMSKVRECAERIREIKEQHGFTRWYEMKWSKISPAKENFYRSIVDYFFDDDDFHFRGLVIPNKDVLEHESFHQTHDDWYYKMYFNLLKVIFKPDDKHHVYLDIKDTRGSQKVKNLHQVLCNSIYDFDHSIIEKIQLVRSHEVEVLQVADILIGALSYLHRGLETSPAKQGIIQRIQKRSGYSLSRNTLLKENKFNIFFWNPTQNDTHTT